MDTGEQTARHCDLITSLNRLDTNQDLYKKGINARESDYLLQIQAGTHDSQNVSRMRDPAYRQSLCLDYVTCSSSEQILKDKGPIVSHRSKNTVSCETHRNEQKPERITAEMNISMIRTA